MACGKERRRIRLTAGLLSLAAGLLLNGCTIRGAQEEPPPEAVPTAPPAAEEPLNEPERWLQLVQKACDSAWDGQKLDVTVDRQVAYSGDCGRLGYYETEAFLYNKESGLCYSLDRNTYYWHDGEGQISYTDRYHYTSAYYANGCLYRQDDQEKRLYLRESYSVFFDIAEVDAYVPVDFSGGHKEIDGDETEGQFRIRLIIDPDSCRDKLFAYHAVQNQLAPENQTVTALTVEYFIGEDGRLRSQTLMVEGSGDLVTSGDDAFPVQYQETVRLRYPSLGEKLRRPVEPEDKREYILSENQA